MEMLKSITTISLLAAVMAAYSQAQPLRKVGAPQPAQVSGYDRGHCVSVRPQLRICKLLSDDKDAFLAERDGKPFGSWPGNSYLGETEDFEVLQGDLDGDRRAELVIANRDSTSAGMGVSHWTIAIFPDAEFRSFEPPLSFTVQDYGAFGTFVTTGRKVNVLTSKWASMSGKGKRGVGLYLVGQWWRYGDGQLHALLNRPIVARRYLSSFEVERLQTLNSTQIPYAWLNNTRTEQVRNDPLLERKAQTDVRGVIESVSLNKVNAGRVVKLNFRVNGGRRDSYVYAPQSLEQGETEISFIGELATGRLYPTRYLPAKPEEWLSQRRGKVRTYAVDLAQSEGLRILWLEPR